MGTKNYRQFKILSVVETSIIGLANSIKFSIKIAVADLICCRTAALKIKINIILTINFEF